MTSALVVVLAALAYMLWAGKWPEIYTFATDQAGSTLGRLMSAPIHLSDDVMITLRTGQVLLETGVPSLNHTDLAQASTSFLMPYVFAPLAFILPSNLAVAVYAGLGLAATLLTFGAIVFFARSTFNGAVLVIALALTQTNLEYALNGWDHLFQGVVFVAALVLSRNAEGSRRLVLIGALLAAGSLLRPDGAFLAAAILAVAALRSADWRRVAVLSGGTAVGLGALMLVVNFVQFGHLMPTTTRLKLGSLIDWQYIWDYARATALGSFTALTVLIVLLVFVLVFHRVMDMKVLWPITIAVALTSLVAIYNSDVFAGGRMFWVPAVVLATAVAMEAPMLAEMGSAYRNDLRPPGQPVPMRSRLLGVIAVIGLVLSVVVAGVVGLGYAVVSANEVDRTGPSNQFVLAEWVNANLDPTQGSIGVFYAGVSFHIPRFEVADFLGKGDETIASTPAHHGLPGHNKWDIDRTLDRWNPQAILPTLVVDIESEEGRAYAEQWLVNEWNHAYLADLFLNEQVHADYRLCYVRDIRGVVEFEARLLLRNDIAANTGDAARCVGWPTSVASRK